MTLDCFSDMCLNLSIHRKAESDPLSNVQTTKFHFHEKGSRTLLFIEKGWSIYEIVCILSMRGP